MRRISLLVITYISLNGCGIITKPLSLEGERFVPFEHSMRVQYNLSPSDLMQLNYYLARPVKLSHQSESDDLQLARGKLVSHNTRIEKEWTIERQTPGVAVQVGPNWIDVSFENGMFLRFGSAQESRELWGERYPLWATRWQQDRGLLSGELAIQGRLFYAEGESRYTYLLIDNQKLTRLYADKRRLKGRTITE